jgi:sodium-dependent phosphate cotransporter
MPESSPLTATKVSKLPQSNTTKTLLIRGLSVLLLLVVFLVNIELLGSAVHLVGKNKLEALMQAIDNPFVGLFIGLLSSAILQSSSAVTSMTVAFVASGILPMQNAIPVVMGANIGTTITSILVAFGHITSKKEFKRAISAALTHNFFNIFSTILLLPLEYLTESLGRLATFVAHTLYSSYGFSKITLFDRTILPISQYILLWTEGYTAWLIIGSVICLMLSIRGFTKLSRQFFTQDEEKFQSFLFGTPQKSLFWGIVVTAAIRSSSATTSLIVPLVAANRVTLQNAFCFIMGANVGTTITALLAAFSKSEQALSIALVHLLFNLFGVLLFLPFPFLRNLVIKAAKFLGKLAFENRIVGFAYLLLTFFVFPFLLILATKKELPKPKNQGFLHSKVAQWRKK